MGRISAICVFAGMCFTLSTVLMHFTTNIETIVALMIFNDFQQNEHDLRFPVDSSVETVLFLFVTNLSQSKEK